MAKTANAPTAADLADYLQRKGTWSAPTGDNLKIPVVVIDARVMFGRTELKVSPIGGSGSVWTVEANVELEPKS